MKHFLFSTLACLTFTQQVMADILMIQLNNSPAEVQAAKDAAAARNEHIIVYPEISPEDAQSLMKIDLQVEGLDSKLKKCNNSRTRDCLVTENKRYQLQLGKNEISKKYQDYMRTNVPLAKVLQILNEQGIKLSSVILSGNTSLPDFWGDFNPSGYSLNDFTTMFNSVHPLGDEIRSLYLWGPYTTTFDNMTSSWKKIFPQADLIAGFEDRAPFGYKVASGDYLKQALSREADLATITDLGALRAFYDSIATASQTSGSFFFHDMFASKSKTLNISDWDQTCSTLNFAQYRNIFQCYYNAEGKCINPPADDSTGILRRSMAALKKNSHCIQAKVIDMPDFDVFIRLIYFNNIKNNFHRQYIKDLRNIDATLASLGAPGNILLASKLATLSRKEIINYVFGVQDFLSKRNFHKKGIGGIEIPDFLEQYDQSLRSNVILLTNAFQLMKGLLLDLNTSKIPFASLDAGGKFPYAEIFSPYQGN